MLVGCFFTEGGPLSNMALHPTIGRGRPLAGERQGVMRTPMTTTRVLQIVALGASVLGYSQSTPLAGDAKDTKVLVDLGFQGDVSCLKDGKTLLASSISLTDAKAIQQF